MGPYEPRSRIIIVIAGRPDLFFIHSTGLRACEPLIKVILLNNRRLFHHTHKDNRYFFFSCYPHNKR